MKKSYLVCNIVFILFFSLFSSLTSAEPQSTVKEKSPPTNLSELKSAIATLISENKVPAIAIAMIDDKGPIWIDAIGKANIEKGIDADKNTLFRIGSTSKMFVALSVLKLVEEGKLSLSDKLMDLAPEISYQNRWQDSHPIRIVHLLEHTAGWDDIHLAEFAHNDPTPATLKQGLDYHPHSRVSRWPPGTRMSYANSGSAVVAYIIEKTTGMNFELGLS